MKYAMNEIHEKPSDAEPEYPHTSWHKMKVRLACITAAAAPTTTAHAYTFTTFP